MFCEGASGTKCNEIEVFPCDKLPNSNVPMNLDKWTTRVDQKIYYYGKPRNVQQGEKS